MLTEQKQSVRVRNNIVRAVLVTGIDNHGNEVAYQKVGNSWFCLYTETFIPHNLMRDFIFPNVMKVRFGDIYFTRLQWIADNCPFEKTSEELGKTK